MAYPGSEFVVANTVAKWKKLEPNEINFSQGFSQKVSTSCFVFLTLCRLCLLIIFENSLDPDQARQNVGPDLDPNCFDTWMVLKNPAFKRVKHGTIIKCLGIIKAIFKKPKADQNILFRKYVIFEPPRLYF